MSKSEAPEYVQFVPDPEPKEALRMLDIALEGLSNVMDFDPLAPQALLAAEALMSVAKITLPYVE